MSASGPGEDPFLRAAIVEARQGLAEGGIPIGSVLVHDGKIIGRGHNKRVQEVRRRCGVEGLLLFGSLCLAETPLSRTGKCD
jgi:hypothetical protein